MEYKLYEIQLSIVLRSSQAFDWLISESVLAALYEKVYELIQVCLHSRDSRISSTVDCGCGVRCKSPPDQTQRVPPCHLNSTFWGRINAMQQNFRSCQMRKQKVAHLIFWVSKLTSTSSLGFIQSNRSLIQSNCSLAQKD